MKILASPNSCFTLIFFEKSSVDLEQLEEKSNMDRLRLNSDLLDVNVTGLYLQLNISSHMSNKNTSNYFNTTIYAFATNDHNELFLGRSSGTLGLGQCPHDLRDDYSFGYQVSKLIYKKQHPNATEEELKSARVDSLEWNVNRTEALNTDDNNLPAGFLLINEGPVNPKITSINDDPVVAEEVIEKWNIEYDASTKRIQNMPFLNANFSLGKLIN